MSVEYLGAGGLAIRSGDQALLTAPFYSNPGFLRVGLGLPIRPIEERIPQSPAILEGADVVGLLVGHAHYDHLMDVPAVLGKWGLGGTPVYGDATAVHLLGNAGWSGAAYAVGGDGDAPKEPRAWIELPSRSGEPTVKPRFRVMPIRSEHAPHFAGVRFFRGEVGAGDAEPVSACDWKEGQTWAYLIDVLADDGETPRLRIHYQDSASNPGVGWPLPALLRERSVDLLAFTAASFKQVEDHPQAVLGALAPRHAMAIHWEDFFRDPREPVRVVRGTNMTKLLKRIRSLEPAVEFSVPRPGQQVHFRVCAAAPTRNLFGATRARRTAA